MRMRKCCGGYEQALDLVLEGPDEVFDSAAGMM